LAICFDFEICFCVVRFRFQKYSLVFGLQKYNFFEKLQTFEEKKILVLYTILFMPPSKHMIFFALYLCLFIFSLSLPCLSQMQKRKTRHIGKIDSSI